MPAAGPLGPDSIVQPLDAPVDPSGENALHADGALVDAAAVAVPRHGTFILNFNAAIGWLVSTWRGRLIIVGVVVAFSAFGYFMQDRISAGRLGYGAVAASVLLASGGLVVPVPALAITCTTATFLHPAAVAVIAGLAGTIGELTGYFLGYSGSGVFERRRFYQRVEHWMRRRGWLLLFVISAVPNPLFDVAGIAAGALRYPLWRYLVAVGLGKQVKFFMVAYGCYYSVQGLKGVFGV